jgi:hypothetical protein
MKYYVTIDNEVVRTYDNFTDARQKANHIAEAKLGEVAVVSNDRIVYTTAEMKL